MLFSGLVVGFNDFGRSFTQGLSLHFVLNFRLVFLIFMHAMGVHMYAVVVVS